MITGKAWSDVNTLLAFLRGGGMDVVELVEQYFSRFNNPAPAELLAEQIEKVQKHLDEGTREDCL
jgi:hypothetical protein